MKTKKFSKKLGLNKNTVSNLNSISMDSIRGGITTYFPECQDPTGDSVCPDKCPRTWSIFVC